MAQLGKNPGAFGRFFGRQVADPDSHGVDGHTFGQERRTVRRKDFATDGPDWHIAGGIDRGRIRVAICFGLDKLQLVESSHQDAKHYKNKEFGY